ncbi:MAG: energy-coupling factor transporter transmembrane component T [Actinomycetes bacterium]
MKPQHRLGASALPRWTHPVAWWAWALGLVACVSRTTNPILLGLIVAVAGWVVARRRPEAPWANSFALFCRLGVVVIAIRVVVAMILGGGLGDHVLFTLPSIQLPDWVAGITLGGPVTAEALLSALYEGAVIAAILACIGAANSLASPARLLATVPAALYEVGVSIVVALSFAPQLVADVSRVQTARRLRGRPHRGVRALAGSVMPVFEGALERAVDLAAAMDSRGYGRTRPMKPRDQFIARALVVMSLIALSIGVYALVDGVDGSWMSWLFVAIGIICAVVGLRIAGRRSIRTRYRPDPWALPEWLVLLSGWIPAALFIAVAVNDPASLAGQTSPLQWPALPTIPAIAVLLAALPGIVTPLPPGGGPISAGTAGELRRQEVLS